MRAYFSMDASQLNAFKGRLDVLIKNVDTGTKKATTAMAKEIYEASIAQVPTSSGTLLESAFYEVSRRADVSQKTYQYQAIIGYGGNGDPVNPKTGRRASSYMLAVHENLTAVHLTGKAKFLEDPVRERSRKFVETFAQDVSEAIDQSNV